MSLSIQRLSLPSVAFFQEGPGLRKWQWTTEGMKVINVTNILGNAAGTVDTSNTDKYISMLEFEEKYSHFAVENRDIVVASSGNTYGKVGRISEDCLPLMMNTSVIRFHTLDHRILDDEYLYAFLRSPDFRSQVDQYVIGGAQPNFGPTHLKKMTIPLPPIDEQKRIGAIVSAYDDLIENNRRRMALLEQAARLLYREWFVHLRFPGHEHVAVVDGVPVGWERKTIGEVAPLSYGKGLKKDDRIPGPFPVYGSSGVVGYHEKALVEGPGIIVGRKGNVGSVFWSTGDFYPIDTVYFVEPKLCSLFLYYTLHNTTFISTDVAVPGLNRDYAHSVAVLVPPHSLLEAFDDFAAPIHEQLARLSRYNEQLVQARDLLLPRLMNGEIGI